MMMISISLLSFHRIITVLQTIIICLKTVAAYHHIDSILFSFLWLCGNELCVCYGYHVCAMMSSLCYSCLHTTTWLKLFFRISNVCVVSLFHVVCLVYFCILMFFNFSSATTLYNFDVMSMILLCVLLCFDCLPLAYIHTH